MYINNISTKVFAQNYTNKKKNISTNNTNLPIQNTVGYEKYPLVSFKALYNVKTKSIDTDLETKKLVKQLDEFLAADMDLEALMHLYERQIMAQMMQKKRKAENLYKESEALFEAKHLSDLQKAERFASLEKQFKQLEKNIFKIKPFEPPKPLDPNIDTGLINRFKTAVLEDNFNLDKVFQDYYSDLNNIRSIEELNEKYPKIKIPDNPEYVISDKIVDTLTRDFFVKLDRLVRKKDKEEIYQFFEANVREILSQSVKNPDEIFKKVFHSTAINILMKYDKISSTNTFSSIPEFRKNKTIKIDDNEQKLLFVDFDEFVLDVLRKQYLENKKLNEIKYTYGDITIPVSSLKENSYKFDKVSEKVKVIINSARKIQAAKRDYVNFDEKKLHERLNFYASKDIGNNEEIFERIVEFDSSDFSQRDKDALVKFLRELDAVDDGEKTVEQALKIISDENLRPQKTEKVDEIEKQQVVENLRIQQKRAFELNGLKAKFDKLMNSLYINDLSGSAMTCAKYRPEKLDDETNANLEYLSNLITENNLKNNKISVKNKIRNWDTYNYYKANESNDDVFENALKYAKMDNGDVDIDKAGLYLVNAETVMNVPQSLEYLNNREFVAAIIERSPSQEDAIEYLCKYDEYNELNDKEKSHLVNFVDKFNLKDSVDKFILKNIIENDYVNTDTKSLVNLNENDTVEATITSKAKQQILDKYMFPLCIEFMTGFEDALSACATERGTSGIKKTGSNNKALEYKLELKLMGHDDRLFSVDNNYYFDVFSDRGLH